MGAVGQDMALADPAWPIYTQCVRAWRSEIAAKEALDRWSHQRTVPRGHHICQSGLQQEALKSRCQCVASRPANLHRPRSVTSWRLCFSRQSLTQERVPVPQRPISNCSRIVNYARYRP